MIARRLRPHANEFELQTPTRHGRFATTRRILKRLKAHSGPISTTRWWSRVRTCTGRAAPLRPGGIYRQGKASRRRQSRSQACEHVVFGTPKSFNADGKSSHDASHQCVLKEGRKSRAYDFVRIHQTLKVTPAMAGGHSQALGNV
jgi:hypothetical protein